jgi:uncharacterized protein with HEPN domain
MRRDRQRLEDILESLDSLPRIIGEGTETEFLSDESTRYAVAQRLTVVGEAAARLSLEVKQSYPAVPWADVVAFRNMLVHEYFGIYWPLVWQTAIDHAPRLRAQIAEILRTEFPE